MMPDPSKPVPLETEAIRAAEAAYRAFPSHIGAMRAAILAADEARGMRVEEKTVAGEPLRIQRLVSRWFPIKGPVDE